MSCLRRFLQLYLTFICVSVSVLAQSDKKPSWIESQPKTNGVFVGIANVSKLNSKEGSVVGDALFRMLLPENKYKDEAREIAIKKIMSSLHLVVEQESLFGKIRGREEFHNVNLDELLVSLFCNRIMDTPLLTKNGEWEDSENYWCYFSIRETAFNSYFSSFEDSVVNKTADLWHSGTRFQKNGEVYKAAFNFAQALDVISPLMYKLEKIEENGIEFDLVKAVYDSYMHVYDDIVITPSTKVIPVIQEEGVPVSFWVTLTQNDISLKDVPVSATMSGNLEIQPRTDEYGRSKFIINEVKPSDRDEIVFSLDDRELFNLPETFASDLFKNHTFQKSSVSLDFFDPMLSVHLNVEPADSSVTEALIALIKTREDFKLVDYLTDADIVIRANLSNQLEDGNVSSGKYAISLYSTSCQLQIHSVETDSLLLDYKIGDMKVMIPSSRNEEKSAKTAYREISKVLARELAIPISEMSYDKRRIYWSKLK